MGSKHKKNKAKKTQSKQTASCCRHVQPVLVQRIVAPDRLQCWHLVVVHQLVQTICRDHVVPVRNPTPERLLIPSSQGNLCSHTGHRPTESR